MNNNDESCRVRRPRRALQIFFNKQLFVFALDKADICRYSKPMKKIFIPIILLLLACTVFAQDVTLTINFTGFVPYKGDIYVVFVNEQNVENKDSEPFYVDSFPATTKDLEYTAQVPEGYYFITTFQDLNKNEELDTNFLKIPKEPIGMSNYDFKGIPGGFDKHKVYVSATENTLAIAVKEF